MTICSRTACALVCSGNSRRGAEQRHRHRASGAAILSIRPPFRPDRFTLQDVYPSGYGSDLEVSVKADGSVEVFSVPYASVAQLLRPGMTRYALSAGKVDDSALRNKPMLYQATRSTGSTIC